MASTDPARWERLKTLLPDVAALEGADRLAFLDRLDDEALRADLDALLVAHDEAEAADRFEEPAFGGEARPDASETTVGPYRLAEEVGRGGMGAVYRAERVDGVFEQTVALKLLPPGLASAGSVERFRAERQILARLEHPHVARLLDGGVTDAGTLGREMPWLAMEFVDGVPLTDYAEQARLSVEARVRLFLQVCQAVAYAHHNLVVHRDLKPSNILVAEDERGVPQVKLLDFGIAKLIEGEEDAEALTRTGMRVMTPEYAAPEQVRGETVTTATDVYALGVLLYELLTGGRPYDVTGLSPSAIERTICDSAPTRPSASVQPAEYDADISAARRLRGDLDTIILKALAKEPAQRYPGADALADDLRRHLDGLPVTARPAGAGYRTRKFIERHRVGTAAAMVVTLALLAATGVSLWQAGVAAAERDRTADALAQAKGTLDFLENTILMGDPQQGDPDAPLSAVLDSAALRVDSEADSAVAGAIHLSLSSVYLGRGLPERAEHHARSALAALGEDEPRAALALTSLAQALADAGRAAEAEPYHERSIALLRESADERQLAVALNVYGATLHALGRAGEAEGRYREALSLQRGYEGDAFVTLNNLSILLNEQGRPEEAVEVMTEMIEALRHLGGANAAYQLCFALVNRAGALSNLGRAVEALDGYRVASAQFIEVLGAEHPETIAAHISTAFHLHRMERFAEAQREAAAALAMAETALGDGHPYTAYAQNVAGTAFCDGSEPARGAALLRASLAARREMIPEGHWILANGESLLGGCLAILGRDDEAEPLLRTSYASLRATLGDEHLKTGEARNRLADFFAARGRGGEAEALGERE